MHDLIGNQNNLFVTSSDINNVNTIACVEMFFTCQINTTDIAIHVEKDVRKTLDGSFYSKPISLKNKGLLNNNNLKYIFLFTCSNLFFRQLLHKVRNKWIWSHQRLTNNFIFKSLFRHYQLQIFGNFLLLNT